MYYPVLTKFTIRGLVLGKISSFILYRPHLALQKHNMNTLHIDPKGNNLTQTVTYFSPQLNIFSYTYILTFKVVYFLSDFKLYSIGINHAYVSASELAPFLCNLINFSFASGQVPLDFKRALVRPIIKRPSLDCSDLNNFRPVSTLSFISKLLERMVCSQLRNYIQKSNLENRFQSAYKEGHSTETALLAVQNDLCQAVDRSGGALLVLLDLSAAFDTLDHSLLQNRLHTVFGLNGKVLSWIHSYLVDRFQSIKINDAVSSITGYLLGFPKVLFWDLFCSTCTPLLWLTLFKNTISSFICMLMTFSCTLGLIQSLKLILTMQSGL